MQRFGWVYSATSVAELERITLEDAYQLPVTQFLNDLLYLKELGKYKQWQARQRK